MKADTSWLLVFPALIALCTSSGLRAQVVANAAPSLDVTLTFIRERAPRSYEPSPPPWFTATDSEVKFSFDKSGAVKITEYYTKERGRLVQSWMFDISDISDVTDYSENSITFKCRDNFNCICFSLKEREISRSGRETPTDYSSKDATTSLKFKGQKDKMTRAFARFRDLVSISPQKDPF